MFVCNLQDLLNVLKAGFYCIYVSQKSQKKMNRLVWIMMFWIVVATMVQAQGPEGINYQAVARDPEGKVLANADMTVRLGIRKGAPDGVLLWQEDHEVTTNAQGLFTVILGGGDGERSGGSLDSFRDIDWSTGDLFLETSLGLTDDGTFLSMGASPVLAVPYAYYAGEVGALPALEVKAPDDLPADSALFVVRRADGQPVFAVYPGGVRVYVDTASSKGPRGGFAIGGFGMTKGEDPYEIFRVTPDSVRIYLNAGPAKKLRGGFAIGGYGVTKGVQDILRVSEDSVRIYINDERKGPRGGFAIGGYGVTKGGSSSFFNVSGEGPVEVINPSEPRILWYPRKEAFLAGRVLIEDPDSVGMNSLSIGYETKAIGQWSTSLGFRTVAASDYSFAIGMSSRAQGVNAFAVGYESMALTDGSYAFGTRAMATGRGAFAFGLPGVTQEGIPTGVLTEASGDFSLAFGVGVRSSGLASLALGANSAASGTFSVALGSGCQAQGVASVALGGNSQSLGDNALAVGSGSVAGRYASIAMGEGAQSLAKFAFALGHNTLAQGEYSVAMGDETQASGLFSMAMGKQSVASGEQSVAFGGVAKADYSLAMGVGTIASSYGSLVLGRYNYDATGLTDEEVSPIAWVENDPILVVGNGSGNLDRSNAMILYKNGELQVKNLQETSDARLKTDIRPFTGALDKIRNIQPVYFRFRDSRTFPGGTQIGFLAQDVRKSLPELVGKDNQGYLTVQYANMTAVLLEALKEQQETIESLKAKIAVLEKEHNEIAELKKELEELINSFYQQDERVRAQE